MTTKMPIGPGHIFWSPGMTLESMEERCILAAYSFYRGVKTTTANSLGISVRTLDAKLERYGVVETERKTAVDRQAEERARELQYARFGGRPTVHAETDQPAIPASAGNGSETHAGLRAQSPTQSAAERAVPLPERKEVQEMLPGKNGANRTAAPRR